MTRFVSPCVAAVALGLCLLAAGVAGVAAPARRAREGDGSASDDGEEASLFVLSWSEASAASLAACDARIDAALAVARLAMTAAEGCDEELDAVTAAAATAGGVAVAGDALLAAAAEEGEEVFFFAAGDGDGERDERAGEAERADDAGAAVVVAEAEFTRLCARLAALAARLAPVSAR